MLLKKNICILFGLIISIVSLAQQHISFKGVSMDNTLYTFVRSLQKNGFVLINSDDKDAILSGSFAGVDIILYVMSTPKTHQVYCATVMYSEMDGWLMLKNQYLTLKKQLNQKYGVPSAVIEQFGSGYSEMNAYWALMADQCIYATTFNTTGGQIMVSIVSPYALPFGDRPRVIIMYEDMINKTLAEKEMSIDI